MKPLLFVCIVFILACQQLHPKGDTSSNTHWDYEGAGSPDHWAELSPDFIKCVEGHFQSPIDLETYDTKKLRGDILQFLYHPSPIDLVNNGHTVQANIEEKNILVALNKEYELKQVHFHAPAEHQIDGIIYPMEMHMVHESEDGTLAVVGTFIKEGKNNDALNVLWENIPTHKDEHQYPAKKCDLIHFLPENHGVIHYTGSLTTPPCSEGVEWFVMEAPIELSKVQIEQFKKLYNHNSRPIQDREARLIESYN